MLRRMFGPKGGQMTGGCRKLHNEELHNLYSSSSIITVMKSRMMRWAGHIWGEEQCIYNFMGKREGKRAIGRHRRRSENNVKMALSEMEWGGMDWIDLAQDRDQWLALMNKVVKFRVP
jgi:hypothetical protein